MYRLTALYLALALTMFALEYIHANDPPAPAPSVVAIMVLNVHFLVELAQVRIAPDDHWISECDLRMVAFGGCNAVLLNALVVAGIWTHRPVENAAYGLPTLVLATFGLVWAAVLYFPVRRPFGLEAV